MTQVFECPSCHARLGRDARLVDEMVTCQCGFSFYAFGNDGMMLIVPAREMSPPVRDRIRELVQSTGRCRDARSAEKGKKDLLSVLRETDAAFLVECGLKKIQAETFGTELMHYYDVETILEIVNEDQDAVVMKKKDQLVVKEQQVHKRSKSNVEYLRLIEQQLGSWPAGPMDGAERKLAEPLHLYAVQPPDKNIREMGSLFGNAM